MHALTSHTHTHIHTEEAFWGHGFWDTCTRLGNHINNGENFIKTNYCLSICCQAAPSDKGPTRSVALSTEPLLLNVSASVSKCATELSFWLYSFCGKLQLDFVDLEAKASSLQQQFITVSLKMAEGLRAF